MNKGKNEGITLIALIVSIIVLLILVGVSLSLVIGEEGIIEKTIIAKLQTEKSQIREIIEVENAATRVDINEKNDEKKLKLLVEKLQTRQELENAQYLINSKFITITTKQGFVFTVLYNGIIIEGKFAYLDISEGSIQLKENGYKQGDNELVTYTGKYIITGTTTENTVSVIEKGAYDITIKDLNIDVSAKNNTIAFLAGNISTGLNVKLNIEGNNKLCSNNASALGWSGVTSDAGGSTLEICGNGRLETTCGNSYSAMCIGGNNAKNITINSGEISAIKRGEKYGNPIGGNNASIIINRW